MPIPSNKRRFSLTLTPENVHRFKAALKKANMPPSVLSTAVDDFLRDMSGTLEKCSEKGNVNLMDFFTMLGEQVMQLQEEEKQHAEKLKEKAAKGKRN